MMIEKYIKKTEEALFSKYLQIPLLFTLAFFIPIIMDGPQILTGSLINLLMILAITQFRVKDILPVFFLPSLSTYTYGLLFGGASNFLLILIPVIGISNIIYVLLFKNLESKYLKYLLPQVCKSIFLYAITYLLVRTVGLPSLFLTAMGITQLLTGSIGIIVAGIITRQRENI